ncbi:MAG: hypothetical protein JWQ97_898 [Phenylobacterium sp.]|nr:hypothetical protein [Phenylobacterium sp.]
MPLRRIGWQACAALAVCLIAIFMWRDLQDLMVLLKVQILGADYSCFWAGAKTALAEPARLYDFRHITDVQGWPLGPRDIRPYIYPPSALFFFIPFTFGPYLAGFTAWIMATGALYLWGAMKAGAPWWVAFAPCVLLVADCGQAPFIMGGLVIGAFAIMDERPTLSGVLLGLAACIKPQIVLLVPIALMADGRWRTLIVAGLTGVVVCAASAAIWGVHIWFDWLGALGRFKDYVAANRGLIMTGSTPYAWLKHAGFNGAWAYLLAPLAVAAVWFTFRTRQELADRLIALFGGILLITPYAMNYEYTLLAPAVAIYLARVKDPRWPMYALATAGFLAFIWNPPALYFALALPLLRRVKIPAPIAAPVLGSFKS